MVLGLDPNKTHGAYNQAHTALICLCLTLPLVLLRLYVRKFMVKTLGLDDYFMIAVQVCKAPFAGHAVLSRLLRLYADSTMSRSPILSIALRILRYACLFQTIPQRIWQLCALLSRQVFCCSLCRDTATVLTNSNTTYSGILP
jgi:hypothetical protein